MARRTGVVVLRATVTLALVRERDADHHREAPPALRELVHDDLPASGGQAGDLAIPAGADVASVLVPADSGAYLWSWRAPYFYCHFSDRVQHSGFVRCLEEVVDRFLADRGMSVARMLRERSWIPVVSRARLRLVAAAHMEETIHTVFTVENILRSTMFDARMDCYVRREGSLQLVATGSILHGYAVSRGPDAGGLATLDDEVCARLGGQQS